MKGASQNFHNLVQLDLTRRAISMIKIRLSPRRKVNLEPRQVPSLMFDVFSCQDPGATSML